MDLVFVDLVCIYFVCADLANGDLIYVDIVYVDLVCVDIEDALLHTSAHLDGFLLANGPHCRYFGCFISLEPIWK